MHRRCAAGIGWWGLLALILAGASFASIALHWSRPAWSDELLHVAQRSCIIAGLVAVVLGAVECWNFRRSGDFRRWVAVASLLLGLAGAAGASELPPESGRTVRCLSCIRRIGVAMQTYSSQHAGVLPSSLQSLDLPFPHGANDFTCPTTGKIRSVIFANPRLPFRDNTIVLWEPQPADGGANVLFHDGTVMFVRYQEKSGPSN